ALPVGLPPIRIRYSGVSPPYHIGNGWFSPPLAMAGSGDSCLPRRSPSRRRPGHLFGPFVPDRGGGVEFRRRLDLLSRSKGPRHRLLVASTPEPVDRSFLRFQALFISPS